MYRSMKERKAWVFHRIKKQLEGLRGFIESISYTHGWLIVRTLSGSQLRSRVNLASEDIISLAHELGLVQESPKHLYFYSKQIEFEA